MPFLTLKVVAKHLFENTTNVSLCHLKGLQVRLSSRCTHLPKIEAAYFYVQCKYICVYLYVYHTSRATFAFQRHKKENSFRKVVLCEWSVLFTCMQISTINHFASQSQLKCSVSWHVAIKVSRTPGDTRLLKIQNPACTLQGSFCVCKYPKSIVIHQRAHPGAV